MRQSRRTTERTWNLQDAKARLSELVDRAMMGEPQVVLRRGEAAAVLISYREFQSTEQPRESLYSFFQNSPLRGLDIDLSRAPDTIDEMRDLDL